MKKYINAIAIFLAFILIIITYASTNNINYVETPDISKKQSITCASYAQVKDKTAHIKEKYGITVLSLDEANYSYYGKVVEKQLNIDRAYQMLVTIEKAMDKYPPGFFRKFKTENGVNFAPTIYLMKASKDLDFVGLTDKQYADNVKLIITDSMEIEATFHHEMMHVIEHFMVFKRYPERPFEAWSAYNPEGFTYKGDTEDAFSTKHFVDKYAMYSEIEDRAMTFEFLMMQSLSHKNIIEANENIKSKAQYICMEIDKTFFKYPEENKEGLYWHQMLK
ncbi:MAG: hypothetical protein RR922_02945 [Clostridia bacterium]